MTNSDLRESLITRRSIYDTFFNLALGPEEPSEVHLFEKCWIFRKLFSPKILHLARNGPRTIHFGRNLVEMKPNRLIKPFRPVLDWFSGLKIEKLVSQKI